jgi:DNA helicase-2/ATP-dependent DNA helicase PcrA
MVQTKSFFDGAADDEEEFVARAWQRYDAALRKARSLDFDDLLLYTLRLLRLPGGPIEAVRNRFHYVLVDEYQDTNAPQYGIVREVTGERKNICVVGDDDQSIYGWRGADVSKILNFEDDFPGAKVVRLETNYRSTKQILDAANKVIENNPRRHKKTLRSAIGPGDSLQLVIADDEHGEADHIACQIQDMVRDEETRWGDVAVLFRTGPQARPFEAQFRARAIPYVLVGGRSFFDRKEVRDVLSYLKLIVNPSDEVALLRAVSAPPRGLGKTSLDRLLSFAVREGLTALGAFERAPEVEGVQKAQGIAAREFALLMATLRRREGSVPARIESVLQAVDYRREVDRSYPDELTREQRWNVVEEIVALAENHQRTKKIPSLEAFLQELALTADDDESPEDASKRNRVVLMTLHAAKGLEFPRVYLVGLEEGLLPHSRALAEGNVEEERRLAYVGLTRAKSYLTLSHTRQRMRHGHPLETLTSRFLYELRGEEPSREWHDAVDVLRPQKSQRKTRRRGRKKAAKKRTRR